MESLKLASTYDDERRKKKNKEEDQEDDEQEKKNNKKNDKARKNEQNKKRKTHQRRRRMRRMRSRRNAGSNNDVRTKWIAMLPNALKQLKEGLLKQRGMKLKVLSLDSKPCLHGRTQLKASGFGSQGVLI